MWGVSSRSLGPRWPFWLSVHLLYYTRKTMTQQLTRAGLKVEWCQPCWQTLPTAGFPSRGGVHPPDRLAHSPCGCPRAGQAAAHLQHGSDAGGLPQTDSMTAAETSVRSRINVVLFSGGSGTQSITEALRRHPQISLTILINAYDDGHSVAGCEGLFPGCWVRPMFARISTG